MTTNEYILIILCIAIFAVFPWLLSKIKQPFHSILKAASALWLLAVIWFFAEDAKIYIKVIMTVLMIVSLIRTTREYLAFERQEKNELKQL